MHQKHRFTRMKMLAAEIYGYSYANYEDHLGIGNIRYEKLMPDDVGTLEKAEQESWDSSRLAKSMEIPVERVASFQRHFREAKDIVDAPTLAESFRRAVRFSIQFALEQGLGDEGSIERLVTQICYRASDFGFRLDMEGQTLSVYSEELRQETKFDDEFWNEQIQRDLKEKLDQDEEKEPG